MILKQEQLLHDLPHAFGATVSDPFQFLSSGDRLCELADCPVPGPFQAIVGALPKLKGFERCVPHLFVHMQAEVELSSMLFLQFHAFQTIHDLLQILALFCLHNGFLHIRP